jgi:hypothetical protein
LNRRIHCGLSGDESNSGSCINNKKPPKEATINNEFNINLGSEKAEQDRKAEDDEPHNVNQQQSLRGRTATPHLAKP